MWGSSSSGASKKVAPRASTETAFQSRIELEITETAGWALVCKGLQDSRRKMPSALDAEFYRCGTSLTLLQSWSTSGIEEGSVKDTTADFVERMARATRNVRVVLYGRPSRDVVENGASQLGCEVEIREPMTEGLRRPRAGLRFAKDAFKSRCEMDVIGDLAEVKAFVKDWQATENNDSGVWDLAFYLSADGKSVTLLKTFADSLTQERHGLRWREHHAARMASLLRITSVCVYGDAKPQVMDEFTSSVHPAPVEHKPRVQACPNFQR